MTLRKAAAQSFSSFSLHFLKPEAFCHPSVQQGNCVCCRLQWNVPLAAGKTKPKCDPKEKQFKSSWGIDDANDDPNDFSGKTQGWRATRAPSRMRDAPCIEIIRGSRGNKHVVSRSWNSFPLVTGGNYEPYLHMFPIQCLLSSKLILSESRERSSPLNPFVSLLSPPFFSPVHMQPPEMDRHKKSKASSSKSLCL